MGEGVKEKKPQPCPSIHSRKGCDDRVLPGHAATEMSQLPLIYIYGSHHIPVLAYMYPVLAAQPEGSAIQTPFCSLCGEQRRGYPVFADSVNHLAGKAGTQYLAIVF